MKKMTDTRFISKIEMSVYDGSSLINHNKIEENESRLMADMRELEIECYSKTVMSIMKKFFNKKISQTMSVKRTYQLFLWG